METIISTLITCMATIITTMLLIRYYIKKDKKDKQVVPIVSILSPRHDEIENRLDYENDQIFFNQDEQSELKGNDILYFCMKTDSGVLHNCKVNITQKGGKSNHKISAQISILNSTRRKIIFYPIKNNDTELHFEIVYETEANEKMKYKVTFKYTQNECAYAERTDELLKRTGFKRFKKKCDATETYKTVYKESDNIDISYTVREFKNKFNIDNFDKIGKE